MTRIIPSISYCLLLCIGLEWPSIGKTFTIYENHVDSDAAAMESDQFQTMDTMAGRRFSQYLAAVAPAEESAAPSRPIDISIPSLRLTFLLIFRQWPPLALDIIIPR